MHLTKLRELQLATSPQPGRPSYLSAASGLVRIGNVLYVVADDELQLGAFPVAGNTPGTLIRMIPGELPDDTEERKKLKPDFEALTALPPFAMYPGGALFAFGSGSKKRRRTCVALSLTEHGVDASSARPMDATDFFEKISRELDDMNIEGALIADDRLLLMHRGNKRHAVNAILAFALPAVLKSIESGDAMARIPILGVQYYDFGAIDGVPLCFTDGTALADGRIVFSAVAEDTSDSYHDGPCVAAAIGVLGALGRLETLNILDQCNKVEGIHAEHDGEAIRLWVVTDADDPAVAASLLTGKIP